jgi:GTPase SAR1 family protein
MQSNIDCRDDETAGAPDGVQSESPLGASVGDILQRACDVIPAQSPTGEFIRAQIQALRARLQAQQLQIAVVGQFKRGKSTLLNALLGAPVLPSAVTPLTAIPTFLRVGDKLELVTKYCDGREERDSVDTVDHLSALLRERVTEDGNPRNRAGIEKVEVRADAPLLRAGIVLIDTPGIGSTYAHNTEVAKAALPECDVALFVVSPDPPITEVELGYLKEIRDVSNGIVVVLNKIDLVEGEDRIRSEKFLSDTVLEGAGIATAWYFSVSARGALAAKTKGDATLLAQSGLPALESYLINFARTKRLEVLEGAIAKKAAGLVGEAGFEVQSRLAALQMPIADLSDRMVRFTAARETFKTERQAIEDVLSGDRSRLLLELDEKAVLLRDSARNKLSSHASRQLSEGHQESDILAQLEVDVPQLFQTEFEQFETQMRAALTQSLRGHQTKGDHLIANVRELAITLLDIPYVAPAAEEAFQPKRVPYWVTVSRQSFVATPNIIESLLPGTIRLERVRARLQHHVDEIVTRNVENLRWALRQNIETAIRDFRTQLDERLQLSQEAIATAMEVGLSRRRQTEDDTRGQLAHLAATLDKFRSLKTHLEELS